jgi:hypothetical protein
MKIGDMNYEWVLLHIRNGEQYAGLARVAGDLNKNEAADGKALQDFMRAMAADLMQPKTEVPQAGTASIEVDRVIELRNPHDVRITSVGAVNQLSVIPLDFGIRVIHLRSQEILFTQFLDDASIIVKQIKAALSPIVQPGASSGEGKTAGGIILPGTGEATRA